MSHQEDADVVAIDLKRRGYTVTIRREPQDKFFHVQIGPFSNKKEADAMRQRTPDRRLQQRHRQIAGGFISAGSASAMALFTACINSSRVSYADASITGSNCIRATPGLIALLPLRIIVCVPEIAIGTIGACVSCARKNGPFLNVESRPSGDRVPSG